MKIRLYLDEDSMAEALVNALRDRGVDVVTANQENMVNRDDADHLDHANSLRRVLYSFNIADYCQLHTEYLDTGKPHAGIILARQQRFSIGEQMRRLLQIVAKRPSEEMQNCLEFLSSWD
jgi:menaquinone-dependent protoporphyrinogen IX oxidase